MINEVIQAIIRQKHGNVKYTVLGHWVTSTPSERKEKFKYKLVGSDRAYYAMYVLYGYND